MSFNPAFAGRNRDFLCFTALYHQQYLGFKNTEQNQISPQWSIPSNNIAPVTQFFSIAAPIKRFGIGVNVIQDKISVLNSTNIKLNASYRFDMGSGSITPGISAGFMQKAIDGTRLKPLNPGDPSVPSARETDGKPDFGFGLMYENLNLNNLYIGYSATHLKSANFQTNASIDFTTMKMHHYLVAGIDYPLGDGSIVLQPAILIKSANLSTYQFDMSAVAWFNNKFWGGVSYRDGDNVNAMVGFNAIDKPKQSMKVGYSYDFTLNALRDFSNNGSTGSHELYISYCFKINIKTKDNFYYRLTPRYLQKM